MEIAGKVLDRAVASELHPEIHSIPIQSTPAPKHTLILGSMASTHRRNDPTSRTGEPPGVMGHGPELPSDGWLGEPRRLPTQEPVRKAWTGTSVPDTATTTTGPVTVRRLRTWQHYTTGGGPVNTVACFAGFRGRVRHEKDDEALRDRLYLEIGRLKVELDWLNKKFRLFGD